MADTSVNADPQNEPRVTVRNLHPSQLQGVGGTPPPGTDPSVSVQTKPGIEGHFQKHWQLYTIGIGLATIGIILYVWWSQKQSSNSDLGVGGTGSSAYGSGVSPDQLWGSQLDADLQNLAAIINQQTPGGGVGGTGGTGGGGGGGGTTQFNPQSLFPAAKNTKGESNNFWVYTTQPGDTLASIEPAGWAQQQASGMIHNNGALYWLPGINPVAQYRNNAAIFQQVGYDYSNPSNKLPVGLKISL